MYCTAVFRGELPSLFVETVFRSQITVPFVLSLVYIVRLYLEVNYLHCLLKQSLGLRYSTFCLLSSVYCTAVFRGELPSLFVETVFRSQIQYVPFVFSLTHVSSEKSYLMCIFVSCL